MHSLHIVDSALYAYCIQSKIIAESLFSLPKERVVFFSNWCILKQEASLHVSNGLFYISSGKNSSLSDEGGVERRWDKLLSQLSVDDPIK